MKKANLYLNTTIILLFLANLLAYALAPQHSKLEAIALKLREIRLNVIPDKYPALLPAFTPKVVETLKHEPTLIPVFLLKLEGSQRGELQINDHEYLDRYEGLKTLDQSTGFLIGSVQRAAQEVQKNPNLKIFVAFTDMEWDDNLEGFGHPNQRQAYLPLPDGTWLGVKGSGQFGGDKDKTFYWRQKEVAYWGLLNKHEAQRSYLLDRLKGKHQAFISSVAYRSLHQVPDGQGNLVQLKELKDQLNQEPIEAVLSFNHVLTPHRLAKFPQLLTFDPYLKKLTQNLRQTLVNLEEIEPNESFGPSQLLHYMARNMAKGEALKENEKLFKITLHVQDVNLAGQETDIEEFMEGIEAKIERNIDIYLSSRKALGKEAMTRNEAKNYLLRNKPFIRELMEKENFWLGGVETKIGMLIQLMDYAREVGQNEVLFPSYMDTFKSFFKEYFNSLDNKNLQVWKKELHRKGLISQSLTRWMDNYVYKVTPYMGTPEDFLHELSGWLQEEIHKRSTVTEQLHQKSA